VSEIDAVTVKPVCVVLCVLLLQKSVFLSLTASQFSTKQLY